MNEEEKEQAKAFYSNRFNEIIDRVNTGMYDLLILDEIMAALNAGFLEESRVLEFLQNKPDTLEVVLTGRNPDEALLALADYVTEMKLRKHPYERGITARRMIEW